uniref:DNA2/NAM7 helicase-like C-terminal domain-containing protein n=1 Tax=Romanomermis culicivorax TaxID=13658 RepID=A0A915IDD1_ROMCU
MQNIGKGIACINLAASLIGQHKMCSKHMVIITSYNAQVKQLRAKIDEACEAILHGKYLSNRSYSSSKLFVAEILAFIRLVLEMMSMQYALTVGIREHLVNEFHHIVLPILVKNQCQCTWLLFPPMLSVGLKLLCRMYNRDSMTTLSA